MSKTSRDDAPAMMRQAAALARPSAPGEGLREAGQIADRVVLDVCELPDRTSPDDWPEALLVTSNELHGIVSEHVAAALSRPDTAGEERRPNADDLARRLVERAMLDRVPAEFAARALLERDDSPLRASPSSDTAGDGESERDAAIANCAEATAFFDQVKASSEEEKAAVGADHWNWLESACRRVAKLAPSSQGEG